MHSSGPALGELCATSVHGPALWASPGDLLHLQDSRLTSCESHSAFRVGVRVIDMHVDI